MRCTCPFENRFAIILNVIININNCLHVVHSFPIILTIFLDYELTPTHVQIQIHTFYKGALGEILDLCLKPGTCVI